MLFSLEALKAQHGDCLLLHWGDPARLILIDGGPGPVFRNSLEPRLEELRESRVGPEESLPVDMLIVSHIDDDHIAGVLGLTKRLLQEADEGAPLIEVALLWHNAFDDIVGNADALSAGVAGITASLSDFIPDDRMRESRLVLASVNQGRTLRNQAARIAGSVNAPFARLVRADAAKKAAKSKSKSKSKTGKAKAGKAKTKSAKSTQVERDGGLTLTVLGPDQERLEELSREWEKKVKELESKDKKAAAQAAAYLDESVANLSSIVLLAEAGPKKSRKRMLLTGDARGDYVLEALERAGLLEPGGTLHVDLLKLPHHGSHHNVDTDFFERITADHYVASGDGRHGNPELATLEMLVESRADGDEYTLWLTYAPEECIEKYPATKVRKLLEKHDVDVRTPEEGALGVCVDLDDPLED
jgi:beta-lactamase superfamily II metal-dependent hydrolase